MASDMIEKLNISDAILPIRDHGMVRIISHHDADGITAAGILCHAMHRSRKRFHATIINHLDCEFVKKLNEQHDEEQLTVFCDMGSGHPDAISEVSGDVLVIDHHIPVGGLSCPHVNPHLAGIDGAFELSASGTVYAVAKGLDRKNIDLAGLAIAGAIGDKQLMIGANADILKEGVQNDAIKVKKGLKIGDGDVTDLLERCIDLYLDFTGDAVKVKNFLEEVNVSGRLSELNESKLRKLATAISLKLLQRASPDVIESLIGDVYLLRHEVIPNVDDLVSALHACTRMNDTGLALSLCLRDATGIAHAMKASIEYQRALIGEMRTAEPDILHGDHIRYLLLRDSDATGIIASTVTRFLYPDQPCIVLNESTDRIKISARGTRCLIARGLDLAEVLRLAAESAGGKGGGHSIAAGAAIPKDAASAFITMADSLVGKQLKGESL